MQEVITGMIGKVTKNMEWTDKKEWKRKIKLQAYKNAKTWILYTLINK